MNFDEWLRWPTKSTDPAANAAIAVLLAIVAISLVVIGGLFLIPVVLIIAIAKGIHWYVNRPTPTDQLYAQSEQRTIAANFPDAWNSSWTPTFDRLSSTPSWDDSSRLPSILFISNITEALYKTEDLNNPLPPLPPANTIEEGRYRDKLIAHQRKPVAAPHTLEVVHSTLGKCYLDFIAALPPIATDDPKNSPDATRWKPFATVPLIDLLPDVGKSVLDLILPYFSEEADQLGLFADLRRQLDRNFHDASGVEYPAPSHKLIMPDAHKGTPQEIVHAYLHDTPFEALFSAHPVLFR